MKILLTGRNGQVGFELAQSLKLIGEVVAVDRSQMDLANISAVREVIRTVKPELIINAAAYTDVEKAENEPITAMQVNFHAPAVMAEEAKRIGGAIIHFSSDYVFNGMKVGGYVEDDITAPLNVYGTSKMKGELAVQLSGVPYIILRTSWIYSLQGKNFLNTVKRLAQNRSELCIVNDQFGAPTWSRTLAISVCNAIKHAAVGNDFKAGIEGYSGLYHLAARGATTWFDFAREIFQYLPATNRPTIVPISSNEYPSLVVRPKNSILDCRKWISTFGDLPQWDEAFRLCMRSKQACFLEC